MAALLAARYRVWWEMGWRTHWKVVQERLTKLPEPDRTQLPMREASDFAK